MLICAYRFWLFLCLYKSLEKRSNFSHHLRVRVREISSESPSEAAFSKNLKNFFLKKLCNSHFEMKICCIFPITFYQVPRKGVFCKWCYSLVGNLVKKSGNKSTFDKKKCTGFTQMNLLSQCLILSRVVCIISFYFYMPPHGEFFMTMSV